MTNKLDQILKEILDKKFNKRISSGYDPEDVDAFFDYVISFIKEINDQANQLLAQTNLKDEQIKNLNDLITKKDNQINLLQTQLDEFKKEGYNNQRIQQELSNIKNYIHNKEKDIQK